MTQKHWPFTIPKTQWQQQFLANSGTYIKELPELQRGMTEIKKLLQSRRKNAKQYTPYTLPQTENNSDSKDDEKKW